MRNATLRYRTAMCVAEGVRTRQRAIAQAALAPQETVNRWMDSPYLVDKDLGYVDKTTLWMNLRLLRGLDVEDFMAGSRHAYIVVQQLAAHRQWDGLEPLLHPVAFESLQEALQVQAPCAEQERLHLAAADLINIRSAVLQRADVVAPGQDVVEGTCHLQVRFEALHGLTMHDLMKGETPMEEPRLQESTWTFEGVASEDDDALHSWRVRDIAWQVHEVKPAEGQEWPGWPSHGP